MKNKILNNLGLKLASLLIALIVWFLVAQIDDPQVQASYFNIPVTLINTELLDQQGKVYEVLDNSAVVNVSIKAPKSVTQKLRASDIVAVADVKKITDIQTVVISYNIQNIEDGSIKSVQGDHDSVKLQVEEKRSKWIKVQYRTSGTVADGYMIMDTTLDQNYIEVAGPKSVVDRISSAVVEIDVEGATSKMSMNVEPQLYDGEGNIIDASSLVRNVTYIHMSVDVLATKTIPVSFNVTGKPADGYLATGDVVCSPESFLVAGAASTLATIDSIPVSNDLLDMTGLTDHLVKTINVKEYLDKRGIRFATAGVKGDVTIMAYIEKKVEKTCLLTERNITISNVPNGYTAEIAEGENPCELRISGLNATVSDVQGTIQGNVNVRNWMVRESITDLQEGTVEMPVDVAVPYDVDKLNDAVIRITITKVEEE